MSEKEPNETKPKSTTKAPTKKRTTTKSKVATKSTTTRKPAKRVTVDLDKLRLEDSCQVRVEMDDDALQDYERSYAEGKTLPAIRVVKVNGELVVVDGFHRVEAARRAKKKSIGCLIIDEGTLKEARGISLEQNHDHGLRRTNADKRKGIEMAIELGWLPKRGKNREVAKRLGISEKLVRMVLKEREPDKADAKAAADIRTPDPVDDASEAGSEPADDPVTEHDVDEEHDDKRDDEQTPGHEPEGNIDPEEDGDYRAAASRLQRVYDRLCKSLSLTDPVCKKVNEAIRLAEKMAADTTTSAKKKAA